VNPDRRFVVGSILFTLAFAAVLIEVVTVGHAYAPGARAIQQTLASTDNWSTFLSTYWFGDAVIFVVRKTYGAIAFAILGFLTAPIFARAKRVVATAALLGIVRVLIELFEHYRLGGYDSKLESAFDIATGTCAAALGAMAWNAFMRRRETGA
jgi:hypothetical protein